EPGVSAISNIRSKTATHTSQNGRLATKKFENTVLRECVTSASRLTFGSTSRKKSEATSARPRLKNSPCSKTLRKHAPWHGNGENVTTSAGGEARAKSLTCAPVRSVFAKNRGEKNP